MPNSALPQQIYDSAYYKSHLGEIPYERNQHWLEFFGGIADNLIRSLRPRSVFDAGCAWGFLVESLRDRGVEAWGRDISGFAIDSVRPDMRDYCAEGSITAAIFGRYDLATCIEVVEHMPADEADRAIGNLCAVADVILFSSSPSDFEEESHINVHPPLYWLRLFQQRGFSPDIGYDASFVSPHAFLLRRFETLLADGVLTLFSEKLRWNREWVAAHQAFCLASDRVQALSKAHEEVSGELSESIRRGEQKQRTLQEWMAQVADLRREMVRWEERETRTRIAEARLKEEVASQQRRAEWAERERGEAREQVSSLQWDMEEAARRAQWELEEARQATVYRDRELEGIYTSPGWKAIVKYREWIERRRQNPVVRKYLEPAIIGVLARAGMGRPVPGPPAGPALAERSLAPQLASQPQAVVETGRVATTPAPVARAEPDYPRWIRQFEPSEEDLRTEREMGAQFPYRPRISIITPVYKVPVAVLRELVDSVMAQTYENWELCLVHAWPGGRETRDYLNYLTTGGGLDSRIRVVLLDENKGIAGNSNEALKLAAGEYAALLDHDDTLPPFALYEMVRALNTQGRADFLYSDKDQLAPGAATQRISPLFKPEWSPETMLSANYLTHLCLMRTELIREIGGWRTETDGAQDWDLFLRLIAKAKQVVHVPKVLYHWRQIETSVASGGMAAKPYAAEAQARTLRDYFGVNGWDADIRCDPEVSVHWRVPSGVRVSVILIAAAGDEEALAFAQSIVARAGDRETEVLLLRNEGADSGDPRIRSFQAEAGDSLQRGLNLLAAKATGEFLIFADRTVRPLDADWIDELAGPLQIAGVGLVGAKLLEEKTLRIRHAGLVFNDAGEPEYIFRGEPEHVFGEFGAAGWCRNWSAVAGACFAVRRSTWELLGGLAENPVYPRADIDLCLRVQFDAKLRIMYNPGARLTQSGISNIELWLSPEKRGQYIKSNFPAGDPYLNPNIVVREGTPGLRRRETHQAKATDYAADSRVFVSCFDFDSAAVSRSRKSAGGAATHQVRSLTWLIPEFTNPWYGGIATILRFADYFGRAHGVHSNFAVLGQCHHSAIRGRIGHAFPELGEKSDVSVLRSVDDIHTLPACDGVMSTLWTTAYAALRFEGARRKFYFVQDYEPFFYPAGSSSALVESTYDFGYYGICNTVGLRDLYVERGGQADYFDPSVNTRVFHADGRKPSQGKPWTVFCYMRPGHSRNGFELISAALHVVKRQLGDDVRILTAGADWDPASYGLEGALHNLGDIGYAASGALYRTCDAGVVMMMTCHPSYLPFELMASGALVVTNRNPHTQWLLRDRENCLLSEGSAGSLAETIVEGLKDGDLRRRITRTASELIAARYSDWDAQAEKVYQCLIRQS